MGSIARDKILSHIFSSKDAFEINAKTLFLTYRLFTKAHELMNDLFSYYTYIEKSRPLTIKSLSVWFSLDPDDFENVDVLTVLSNWEAVIRSLGDNESKAAMESFRQLFSKPKERVAPESQEFCSAKEVKKMERVKSQDLIDKASDAFMASQLTLIDFGFMKSVKVSELLRKDWGKDKESPLISVFQNFNRTVHWIATEILSENSSKKRAAMLSNFIKIGNIFIKMGNYNGAAKVFRALTLPFIARLQKTWKILTQAERIAWENICKTIELDDTVQLMKASQTSFALINSINQFVPEAPNGSINFDQLSEMAVVLDSFQRSQKKPYNITADMRNLKYFKEECKVDYFHNLARLSLLYEPDELESQRFFFGKINRGEAESILRSCEYDAYLVTKNKQGVIEMSLWSYSKKLAAHSPFTASSKEGFSIKGSDQSFKELSNFLEFSREMYGHSPAWNSEAKASDVDDDSFNALYSRHKSPVAFAILGTLSDYFCYPLDSTMPKLAVDSKKIEAANNAIKATNIPLLVEILKDGLPINTVFKNEMTLLHVAAEANCPRLVDYVMECEDQIKPDINARNADGLTALHLACFKDGRLKVVSRLLKYNASVNAPSLSGQLPLHLLVKLITEDKQSYSVSLFVMAEKGVSINCQDANKATPLHEACLGGNLDAVKFLLERKADTTLLNKLNETPLAVAQKNNFKEIVDLLKRYPTAPQTLANDLAVHNGDFILDNGSEKVSYKAELSSLRNESAQGMPYKHYFSEHPDHVNILTKGPLGIVTISTLKGQLGSRILIRSIYRDTNIVTPILSESNDFVESLKFFLKGEFFVYPTPDIGPVLLNFEQNIISVKPTYGILYLADGRYTEDKIYTTVQPTASYEDFLSFLGKKVPFTLAVHDDYDRLKTSTDDTEYALASQYLTETTIIFHVAHGLPKDQRKTLATGHSVIIVFLDSSFIDLSIFEGTSVNVVFIIQPLKTPDNRSVGYRMSICKRKGIAKFSPALHYPSVFIRDEYFKYYLLTAIQNAEQQAPAKSLIESTPKIRDKRFERFHQVGKFYIFLIVQDFSNRESFSGSGREVYKLGRTLGSGQSGVAYECKNKRTKKKYCMKVVDKTKLDPEVLKRVVQEFDLLSKLKRYHNIVRFYEKFDSEEDLWIVLELCEGGSLKDDVKYRGKYTETQAASVMMQLLEALEGMHSEAICHRDLKPENVLFKDKEKKIVKIADFGLAKDLANQSIQHSIAGTLDYVAPEVLEGYEYDYLKVDMWSLGCICYFLLYGNPPFQQMSNMNEFFQAVRNAQYTFPNHITKISEDAKNFIQKLLTVDYVRRCSAAEAKQHPWLKVAQTPTFVDDDPVAETVEDINY